MPVSLEHDCLKNAVVKIAYTSEYNVRYISHLVQKAINESTSHKFEEIPTKDSRVSNESLSYRITDDQIMLANTFYRILISAKSITFNFTKTYRGWAEYSKLIRCVLSSLQSIKLQDVNLQYISSFETVDIFDALDGTIQLTRLPHFNGSVFSFSCNCNSKNRAIAEATIKLTNNKEFLNTRFSIVEISITGKAKDYKSDECLQLLADCHDYEKHLFFLLLSEDFINKLHPHYE